MPAPPQPGVDFYGRDPWEAFSSNADGTNDYLTITPSITNAKSFHYRCWIHPKGDGTERVLVANDNAANVGIRIILTTTNQLQVVLRNTSGTTILDATSLSNGYIDAMGMGTIDINVDLNATTYQILLNGRDDAPTTAATAPVNDTIDFGGNWAFWADPDGSQPFNGDVSQVFAIFGQTYIDLDTDSNWAKFVEDAALRPANLGYNGARPYSAAPAFFLPMDSDDPGQNWGSESDLTENGTFTAGTLTPLNFIYREPLSGSFDGSTMSLFETTSAASTNQDEATFIVTIEPDTLNNGRPYTIGSNRLRMVVESGAVRFEMANSSAIIIGNFTVPALTINTKYQIVFAVDFVSPGRVKIWVNGVLQTVTETTFTLDDQYELMHLRHEIGAINGGTSNWFDGSIGTVYLRNAYIDNIGALWDFTNSLPKWLGRSGGNVDATQPHILQGLPGLGLNRNFGSMPDTAVRAGSLTVDGFWS